MEPMKQNGWVYYALKVELISVLFFGWFASKSLVLRVILILFFRSFSLCDFGLPFIYINIHT